VLVKEIMSKSVEVIHFDRSVQEAAKKMASGNFGILPVEKNDKMVGMISDRDITLRLAAMNKNAGQTTVEECMSKGVNFCYEDDAVEVLAKMMEDTRHRRIPVINKEKRLVGIVSYGDLVTKAKNRDLSQKTFEHICNWGPETRTVAEMPGF